LYELLTLEPAFASSDRQELLRLIASEEPCPPRQLNPAIPKELETIVLKALEKSPEGRYATAQELADDLRRFLDDKPITARRPTLVERTLRWSRRHKYLLRSAVAILMVAVLALALGAWRLWQKQREILAAYGAEARQRQRAEVNLALARQAANDMYTGFAEKWLAEQPHLTEVQRQLLERALQFYQSFAKEAGTEPAVQLEAVRAYLRVGSIQSKLGAHMEA
jgi:hypothetical protein